LLTDSGTGRIRGPVSSVLSILRSFSATIKSRSIIKGLLWSESKGRVIGGYEGHRKNILRLV
jgi:hypothetical protein